MIVLTRLLRVVSRRRKNAFTVCMHPINYEPEINRKSVSRKEYEKFSVSCS